VPGPLVECVPNFSEGRRPEILARLGDAVRGVRGVRLQDVSPDPDHNRAVFTIIGRPEAVYDAAYGSAAAAVALLDLRTHRGVHPRIGAVDVIPFVPLDGASIGDCVALARRLSEALAARFDLPVYLYAAAASDPARRTLAAIRRGGFEGLREAITAPERRPDFGPARVHPTAGAVAIGARDILIAMNVDLDSMDLEAARTIAQAVRESSGGLPAVQAMGLVLPSRGCVQVSMNLLDYRRTPPAQAFERVAAEAARLGIAVAAGELIGCAPAEALPPDPVRTLRLRALRPEQILDLAALARELGGTAS
jgi:glutamate formiminotransferase / 5-formyltetrahydrofolate cyclo-ligase